MKLREFTGGAEDLFVFRGFTGRLVAKSPEKTAPGPERISYDQYLRFLGLWFSDVLGISLEAFRKQFATQSGRSGGASAAANAGVPAELWGHHGDRKSFESQRRYMKIDPTRLLSVSRAATGLLKGLAPGERIGDESAGVPPEVAEEGLPPAVAGVPDEAFTWL